MNEEMKMSQECEKSEQKEQEKLDKVTHLFFRSLHVYSYMHVYICDCMM